MTHPSKQEPLSTSSWLTSGWVEAGLFVIVISALNVIYAIADQSGAHVVTFVLYSMVFAAIGMLLVTGPGDDWREVITARQSWIYGAATIAMEVFYYLLVAVTSPAEGSLLMRLSVPASVFVGALALGRTTPSLTLVGCVVILASIVPVFLGVPVENVWQAVVLTITCGLIVAIKTFASELHPWNRAAKTVGEKMRITGLVVLATAIMGAGVLLIALLLTAAAVVPQVAFIPAPSDFAHIPTIGLAILLGAPVIFAITYLTFSSVVKIGTESFLATSAFTPFATVLLQMAAVAFGWIATPAFELWLIPLAIIGVVGVLIVIRSRHG